MWTEQRTGTGLELSYAKRSRSSGDPVSPVPLCSFTVFQTHTLGSVWVLSCPLHRGRLEGEELEARVEPPFRGSCKGRGRRAQARTRGAGPGPPLRPSPTPSLPCASLSTCRRGLGWTAASTCPRLPCSWSDRPGRVPGARTVSDLPGWSAIPTYTARKEMKQSCKPGSTAEGARPSPCCPSPPRTEGPR